MKFSLYRILFAAFLFCFLYSCKKDDLISKQNLLDYYLLQVGKVFIYRLDSTVTAPFGTALLLKSYHAKDSIASLFNDNLGRESYTVYRFTTDTLEQFPWQYQSTYYITPTDETIELTDDNNLRFIKLKLPVRNNFSWQGNSYIDTRSANSAYQYLDGWNYTYSEVNMPYTVLKGMLDSTVTVLQRDETSPEGPFDPQFYQQRNYSVEIYGKGVGLIYKDFLHSTWQTTPEPAHYENDSYGIKLNLIEVR